MSECTVIHQYIHHHIHHRTRNVFGSRPVVQEAEHEVSRLSGGRYW